jgi:hypothetical protein
MHFKREKKEAVVKWIFSIWAFCFCMTLQGEPRCYQDLADHFFDNDKAIMQALSLHRVTQSSWTPIIRDLQQRSRLAYPLAKQRARSLQPNPLDPFQPEPAEKVLMYTLLEIFQGVLNSYLITNPDDITEMFDDIRRRQSAWPVCFPPPRKENK